MADTAATPLPAQATPKPSTPKSLSKYQMNKLYALPAPLRTFPLPTLVPHNPLSLFHILYVWISQAVRPPSSNIDPYVGWWSPETRSIHVTDSRSIRGLWEQGFYGKGILSRSEPNWLAKELAKGGGQPKMTAEQYTQQRREQRQQVKWERARKEREAIDQKLLEEAELARNASADRTPPLEAFVDTADTPGAIPENDLLDEKASTPETSKPASKQTVIPNDHDRWFHSAPTGPLELLKLPNSEEDILFAAPTQLDAQDLIEPEVGSLSGGHDLLKGGLEPFHSHNHIAANGDLEQFPSHDGNSLNGLHINGYSHPIKAPTLEMPDDSVNSSTSSDDANHTNSTTPVLPALVRPGMPGRKRQKSVRFSPMVEKNTFIDSEPPKPELAPAPELKELQTTVDHVVEPSVLKNQEHTQLTMEEAFYLSYAFGALKVLDPITKSEIATKELFGLFRRSSCLSPYPNPSLSPDDPFMLNYVVYHHYRSLGWCVRAGAKFSCDFMLYTRGPPFSHAEFAIVVLPSYTAEYWSGDAFLRKYVQKQETRTWSWMHCINRVISQVKKTLVLVYVDIPAPQDLESQEKLGVAGILGRYKVREFVMKRFLANRERD